MQGPLTEERGRTPLHPLSHTVDCDDEGAQCGSGRSSVDFEFFMSLPAAPTMETSASMLFADELFNEGKLVPLHHTVNNAVPTASNQSQGFIHSPYFTYPKPSRNDTGLGPLLPNGTTCSIQCKELLRLQRLEKPEDSTNLMATNGQALAVESTAYVGTRAHHNLEHILGVREVLESCTDEMTCSCLEQAADSVKKTEMSIMSGSQEENKCNDVLTNWARNLPLTNQKDATASSRGRPRGSVESSAAINMASTDLSRSSIAPRLNVPRGLDRSCSSPRGWRPKQMRSGKKAGLQGGDGHPGSSVLTLQRSSSYSVGVRVSPIINVPVYSAPALIRKGFNPAIFHFFSFNKDKSLSSRSIRRLRGSL